MICGLSMTTKIHSNFTHNFFCFTDIQKYLSFYLLEAKSQDPICSLEQCQTKSAEGLGDP